MKLNFIIKKECNTKCQLQTRWKQLPVLQKHLPVLRKKSSGVPRCLYHASEPDPTFTKTPAKPSPHPRARTLQNKTYASHLIKDQSVFYQPEGKRFVPCVGKLSPFFVLLQEVRHSIRIYGKCQEEGS